MAFSVATYVLKNNVRERQRDRERRELHEREGLEENFRRQSQLEVLRELPSVVEDFRTSVVEVDDYDREMRAQEQEEIEREHVDSSNTEEGSTGEATCSVEIADEGETENGASCSSSQELFECRICQSEDTVDKLDSPCSCRGSLKYVHGSCLQKWCLEKGDTICEICKAPLKGGYTVPERSSGGDEAYPSSFVGWLISSDRLQGRNSRQQYRRPFLRKVYLWILLGCLTLYTLLFFFRTQSSFGHFTKYFVAFVFKTVALFVLFSILLRIFIRTWHYFRYVPNEPTIFLYNTHTSRHVVVV